MAMTALTGMKESIHTIGWYTVVNIELLFVHIGALHLFISRVLLPTENVGPPKVTNTAKGPTQGRVTEEKLMGPGVGKISWHSSLQTLSGKSIS